MTDISQPNWSERDDRNNEVVPQGWPDTLPASVGQVGRATAAGIKRFWNRANPVYVTTGSADNYVVMTESQPAFLTLFEIIRVRVNRSNTTTTPTLKYARPSPRTIVKISSAGIVPVIAGDMVAGKDHSFWFNGTNFVLADPGTVDSSAVIGVLKTANNLSELTATQVTARGNIGAAPLDSPTFTGTVTIPSGAAISGYAPLAGPTFTGVPAAPTASPGANSTQIATTAYADAIASLKLSLTGGTMSGAVNYNYNALNNPAGVFLTGYLNGLTLANNATDAVNDIDIAVGRAASDGATPVLMSLASGLTKQTDVLWAVGNNQGGLDTGTVGNNTYHVFLIQRSDTAVVDILYSLSATAPTMPTNYDRKRRIGSIVRVGGSIKAFSQNGDEFLWLVAAGDVSGVAISTTALTPALTVPTGIKVNALFNGNLFSATAGALGLLSAIDQTSSVANTPAGNASFYIPAANTSNVGSFNIRTNTSGQIRVIASVASSYNISTFGWIDTRGKLQ